MNAKIKICRIVDLETAVKLVSQGVDFLGFHIIEESDLHLLEVYSTINAYLIERFNYYNSVIVTKIENPETISNVLLNSNFNYIQFHYVLSNEIQQLIKDREGQKNFITIYDPKIGDQAYFNQLRTISKYIILDNIKGGQGKRVKIDKNIFLRHDNVFIAGGVNLGNIKMLNERYHPFGFDIQSGSEITKGVKDFERIKKMQKAVQ